MLDAFFEIGQTFSLFLVLVFMEGIIAAKTKTIWPGLAFLGAVVLLAIGIAVLFGEPIFFLYMLIPVALCFGAFCLSRWNIKKGNVYREESEEK